MAQGIAYYNRTRSGLPNIDVNGFRMDLGSNATTLATTCVTSSQIRLYNPTNLQWEVCNITTAPTSSATGALNVIGGAQALAVDKIYDVFAAYNSSTAFDLEFSPWASAGAGTSARTAAYAGGTTYAVGDRVVDSSVYYVCIQAGSGHTPASSPTYWTSCGAIPANTDFTGLYQADGIWVSGNSPTQKSKRWLGVIYAFNNSTAVNFKDDVNYRYVSNFYNRKSKLLIVINSAANWTYGTNATRELNAGTSHVRGKVVLALTQNADMSCVENLYNGGSAAGYRLAWGLNSASEERCPSDITCPSGNIQTCIRLNDPIAIGYNFITLTERATSGANITPLGEGILIAGGMFSL